MYLEFTGTQSILPNTGFRVIKATNGEQAHWKLVGSRKPDLILLDVGCQR